MNIYFAHERVGSRNFKWAPYKLKKKLEKNDIIGWKEFYLGILFFIRNRG